MKLVKTFKKRFNIWWNDSFYINIYNWSVITKKAIRKIKKQTVNTLENSMQGQAIRKVNSKESTKSKYLTKLNNTT